MPIYEYSCQDCGASLELLLDMDAGEPALCGFRCHLKRGENDDLRGNGQLSRQLSSFQQVSEASKHDHPTPETAAKFGFTSYKNNGNGTFQKIAGTQGPDVLKK